LGFGPRIKIYRDRTNIIIMKLISDERAQVSIEFVLLTGGVVVAALTFFSLQGSIRGFANVTSEWVKTERDASLTKITR
jgi:uncharacterized protein (UPF0333 family)